MAGDNCKTDYFRNDFCLDTMEMKLTALKLVKPTSWGVLIRYRVH